jgi:hypothetical protein
LVSLGNWLANPSHSLKGVTADSHTWLDEVGALLVVFGVVFSMVNRSETGKRAIDDRAFCKFVLLPVTLGAFYRVAQACSWLKDGKPPNSLMLIQWVMGCAIAFLFMRAVSYILISVNALRTRITPKLAISTALLELPAQFAGGALVGLVIWYGMRLCLSNETQELSSLDHVSVFGVPWFLTAATIRDCGLQAFASGEHECRLAAVTANFDDRFRFRVPRNLAHREG